MSRKESAFAIFADTLEKGLVLQLNLTKGFEYYADFAGDYNNAYVDESSTAFSHSGYVIYYAGFPIMWGPKLQSTVVLSTTRAKHFALSTAAREASL